MTDIALRILLQAQDTASRVVSNFGGNLLKMAGDLKPVLIGAGLVGGALLGIGVVAAKMAGDFQQATNQLITTAGETAANIGMVRDGILKMSVDTATSWQQLVAGMYNVESAGYHGAAGLAVLKAAAQGAKAENADLNVVTDVLTTAIHNYRLPVSQAVDVMNSFIQTTSQGKMHLSDLTTALRNVLPVASVAKVSLTDVEAALATMSLAGDKGAAAGTHLSQMLTYLLSPSSKATKILKEVGLTTQQISDEMKKSLPGTVQMITDAVGKKFPVGSAAYVASLSAIVGGNKSMKAMLELSGTSLQDFKQKLAMIAPTMKANATAVDNWALIQSGFNFQMEAAKNAVIALLIKIGTGLLPILTRIVAAVGPVVSWFLSMADAVSQNQTAMDAIKAVLLTVAGIITGVLIYALVGWAAAMIPVALETLATMAPFILLGIVAAAVIFGIMQLVRNWGAVMSWLGTQVHRIIFGIIDWFKSLSGGFKALLVVALIVFAPIVALILGVILVVKNWGAIMAWFGGVFSKIGSFIHSIISKIGDAFSWLGSTIHSIWDGIVSKIKGAINFIIGLINGFIGGIDNIHISAGPIQIGFAIPKIPYLASGGYVERSGFAMIHQGETVIPARASPLGGAGAGAGVVNMYVTINGPSRQMADQFLDEVSRRLKQRGALVSWTSGGKAT